MRDATLSPGKRLRPVLLLLAAHQCGGNPVDALDAACAVELVHAASLVLDDLPCMDDATLRRGRPAVHVAHGEDIAILAAIGMLNLAFAAIAGCRKLPDASRGRMIRSLSRAVGADGLVAGQELDLYGAGRAAGIADAVACNRLKTSALIEAALACGAEAAGADMRSRRALARYARGVGDAFQLGDDLLDMRSTPERAGKDVGQDSGRMTAAAMLGVRGTMGAIESGLARARALLDDAPCGPEPLASYVDATFREMAGRHAPRPKASAPVLILKESGHDLRA